MRLTTLILFTMLSTTIYSQNMDNEKLLEIIQAQADTLQGDLGNWKFVYKEIPMLCVTDQTNNRMRIITPIIESSKLNEELLLDSMTANFHSALDVKYAISNGILWSAYVHPLKELSNEQVESAISQVYYAAKTFGTTFSSTELLFGAGSLEEKKKEPVIKEEKTGKF